MDSKKVGASKVGRKQAVNVVTKEKRYVFPDKIPDGFELRSWNTLNDNT